MLARGITEVEVRHVIEVGDVIERYPDDKPFPSRLILGWREKRPIHVCAADDPTTKDTYVITVYEPDSALWESDFRSRRKR
ncbi:DUF4258 domain-containing protein [Candidatus Binatia bacterium]|nr:DUF4258 domain-containing protein [Candidatus Binatia bacterium]